MTVALPRVNWAGSYQPNVAGDILTNGPGAYAVSPNFAATTNPLPAALYTGSVIINMTGAYGTDYTNANNAGLGAKPAGWTWHHVFNMWQVPPATYCCSMQLVIQALHEYTYVHYGACMQYRNLPGQHGAYHLNAHGFTLRETVNKANETLFYRAAEDRSLFERKTGQKMPRILEDIHDAANGRAVNSVLIHLASGDVLDGEIITVEDICYIMTETMAGGIFIKEAPDYYPLYRDPFGNLVLVAIHAGWPLLYWAHEFGSFEKVTVTGAELLTLWQ